MRSSLPALRAHLWAQTFQPSLSPISTNGGGARYSGLNPFLKADRRIKWIDIQHVTVGRREIFNWLRQIEVTLNLAGALAWFRANLPNRC
jgi:hypothetical protein